MSDEHHKRTLTDEDYEVLRNIFLSGLTPEEHRDHHDAMRIWVKRENQKAERYEKVKTHVIGWGAVSLLSGFVYNIGLWVKDHFK